ncbi:MAG: M48 family metallopeptidase [Clostridia bacterium]|nr:M48 family metallopeptidase [Clostridia bacterium]
MVNPNMIIRSNRRTLSLTINKDAELIVKAPKKMSLEKIMTFIKEKDHWIKSKQSEIMSRRSYNKNIIDYNEYLFLGKRYQLNILKGIKHIELTQEYICVPDKVSKDVFIKHIVRWYVKTAKNILYERLEYFSKIMDLDYTKLRIINSKRLWGSCKVTTRVISLNFRLVMLPHELLDYIIVHELSHLVVANHSSNFYKVIETVIPNYKNLIKEIREYDYLLGLYR